MPPPSVQYTDVLIAGSGSAGLCASLWLARYGIPHITLERRPGPLRVGQADGVQCRTVEILESFGLAEIVLREAYHVLEVAFWSSSPAAVDGEDGGAADGVRGIRRTHFAADTAPGLSHLPHVILNQARVNGLLIGEMERSAAERGGSAAIQYGCEVRSVAVDGDAADPQAHAVRVTAVKDGVEREYRAKYVLVCFGLSPLPPTGTCPPTRPSVRLVCHLIHVPTHIPTYLPITLLLVYLSLPTTSSRILTRILSILPYFLPLLHLSASYLTSSPSLPRHLYQPTSQSAYYSYLPTKPCYTTPN